MRGVSKNFSREEFECSDGCGFAAVDIELIEVLEELRRHFQRPIIVTSGCRCPRQNENVGGAEKSMHLLGMAADIIVRNVPAEAVFYYLHGEYHSSYGIGRSVDFTHIDVRDVKARWDCR